MAKHHFNPATGETGICRADPTNPRSRGCKFKMGEDEHYPTAKDAAAAWNALQDQTLPSHSKTSNSVVERLQEKFFPSPPQMLTPEEAETLTTEMIAEHEDLKETLDHSHKHSLSFYTTTGYKPMNRYLRLDEYLDPMDEHDEDDERSRHYSIPNHVQRVLSVMEQAQEAAEPRRLYRYISHRKSLSSQERIDSEWAVGSTWSDKGIMSTTQDPALIAGTINKHRREKHVALEFVTKKGISLQNSEERYGSLQTFEKERLISPNAEFVVVGVTTQTYKAHPDRQAFHEEFQKRDYGSGYVEPIRGKKVMTVQLVDKSLLTEEELAELGYDK